MKIHIIGAGGTGKTFYADKISKQYNLPHFDLDDIFWDNNAISYGTRMPIERRTELLNKILVTHLTQKQDFEYISITLGIRLKQSA